MIRNGRALFISLVIHGSLAAAAIFAMYSFSKKEKPGQEAKICISLKQYAQPVAKAPVIEKPKEQPKPKPVEKKVKQVKKPEPVKPKKVVKKVVPEPAPIVLPEEKVIEETAEEVAEVAEETVEQATQEVESTVTAAAKEVSEEVVPVMSAGDAYLQEHLAVIAALLRENLYYPRIARKRGITGEVVVAFELQSNGEALDVNVKSGQHAILNKAAVKTIERLSGRFPKPEQPITLHVPIRYELQ